MRRAAKIGTETDGNSIKKGTRIVIEIKYKFTSDDSVDPDEIDIDIQNMLMDRYELNQCDCCHSWQKSATEMYWRGEDCMQTTTILQTHDYTAVCDECFENLKDQVTCRNKPKEKETSNG
jgi:hypothetical protein